MLTKEVALAVGLGGEQCITVSTREWLLAYGKHRYITVCFLLLLMIDMGLTKL